MNQLREYQASAVEKVRASWAAGKKRPLLVAPTGAGKTQMAEALLADARSAMAIVHTTTLLEQTVRRIPTARVYTVQSLIALGLLGDKRRDGLARHDMCFVDEAHHLGAGEWSRVLPFLSHTRVFGCTATPMRSDGTPLGDCFDDLIVAAQYSALVKDGHLVKCDVSRSDISRSAQKKQKVRPDGVVAYLEQGKRLDGSWRPGIHFEVTIEACQEAVDRYRQAGLRAALVCCDTSTDERRKLFDAYTLGELDMLCSPTALAEGFDSPRAEVCILRRSVDHVGDYLQRVGRVLRPAPGKERALLIDICNASTKHGLPTNDRVYSLEGKGIASVPTEPEKDLDAEPVPPPQPWQVIESRYSLIRDTLLSRYRDFQAEANEKGYKQGWVWHRFTEATSIAPPRMFQAKYRSTCVHCRKRLNIDETMFWTSTGVVHHESCFFASLDGERLEHASAALEQADLPRSKRAPAPVGDDGYGDIPF